MKMEMVEKTEVVQHSGENLCPEHEVREELKRQIISKFEKATVDLSSYENSGREKTMPKSFFSVLLHSSNFPCGLKGIILYFTGFAAVFLSFFIFASYICTFAR